MEARQAPGCQGSERAASGFSWKPLTRPSSSTSRMPKRRASTSGTSMAPSDTAAPRAMWTSSMRP
jgi:hypothetical protein